MTAFIAVAALLVLAVLAVILPPLLRNRSAQSISTTGLASNAVIYGEQLAELDSELKAGAISETQWAASQSEIERRVLEDEAAAPAALHRRSPLAGIVLAVAIPMAAAGIYAWLGTPAALSPETIARQDPAHSVTPEQIAAMVDRLAAKMEANPGDVEGWVMLGRSYAVLNRYREAAGAYSKASNLRPNDATLLADYADILGMANGRKLAGEPAAIVARALKADPRNIKALALAGTAAFEKSDYRAAIRYWESATGLLTEDSEFRQSLQSGIAEARGHLGQGTSVATNKQGREAPVKATVGANLQGTVSIAASIASQARPDDTVYVFARAAKGPRMPLAVVRKKVSEMPFTFSLDDSMAMTPDLKLSGFPEVVVVARISASGLANPQKGDLEAVSAPVTPLSKGIKLEISKARD
jgi:cytochrome c-type biogenesis protein CcmH